MIPAQEPDRESERLAALRRHAILDTSPEQSYGDLAALAAQFLSVPFAWIGLVDRDRLWCKAQHGLAITAIPRDLSFCAHAILEPEQVFVVPDATADPRFCDSPLVVGDPGIRFYAGAPIVTADGHALGTLCALDTRPRTLDPAQQQVLCALARQAALLLESRRRLLDLQQSHWELDEVRERYDLVLRGSRDGIWDWEVAENEVFYSPRSMELLAVDPADLRDAFAAWAGRLHPADRDRVLAELQAHLAGADHFDSEYRLRMPDGSFRWFQSRGAAVRDAAGRATRMAGSLTDITTRKNAEELLVRTSHLLEESQRMARVGGWSYDLDRDELFWTDETYRIHELTPAEYTPTIATAIAFYAPESVPVITAAVDAAIARGEPYALELELITAKGRRIWVLANGKAVFDGDRVVRILGAFQDITARKQADEELRGAKAAAEAANRAKSEFLATMSHEIRTPLNGVLGFADLLLGTGLTEEQVGLTRTIESSGRTLLALIDDVLDFSKIEAGRMDLEQIPFSLGEVLRDVFAVVQPIANEKGIALESELDPRLPQWLAGDPARLRQVLLNLVGNAVKFTAQGSVLVAARGCGPDRLELLVRDTGIGIPRETQDALFERFRQADASTRRRYGGSGLGLAICKQIVELMDGSIGVRSEPGVGSTFRIELPVRVPAAIPVEDDEVGESSPATVATGRRGRILVAEDHAVNQRLVRRMLQRLGHEVDLVASGVDAVAEAGSGRYDLVLMDCLMPEMDGYEAAAAIRAREATTGKRVPIIALTASALAGDRERCLAAGMDDYVKKPFDQNTLQQAIQRWLR